MFKNATFLSFYFADNQLFSNSETLVNYKKYQCLPFHINSKHKINKANEIY